MENGPPEPTNLFLHYTKADNQVNIASTLPLIQGKIFWLYAIKDKENVDSFP